MDLLLQLKCLFSRHKRSTAVILILVSETNSVKVDKRIKLSFESLRHYSVVEAKQFFIDGEFKN